MTSSIQYLREMIPLYLNGSLSEQQASDFRQGIKNYPDLEQELSEFRDIDEAFDSHPIPDNEHFDVLFKQIEAKINRDSESPVHLPAHQDSFLDKVKGLIFNPFVGWGVALAQFAVVAFILMNVQPETTDVRYQSLSQAAPENAASINIVFRETATVLQVNALLLEHQLDIVSGPGRGKVFLLSVKDTSGLDEIVDLLRQSDIVRFTEKIKIR